MAFYNSDNLDETYSIISRAYNLTANDCVRIKETLEKIVPDMDNHWKSSDASVQKNNIGRMCQGLGNLIQALLPILEAAGNSIVDTQEIRKNNGGFGEVGTRLQHKEITINQLPEYDEHTPAYTIDDGIEKVIGDFSTCSDDFSKFNSEIINAADNLLQIWKEGEDRTKLEKALNEYRENSELYKKTFADLKEKYETNLKPNLRKVGTSISGSANYIA